MNNQSQEELVSSVIDSLELLDREDPATNKLASYLYVVDHRLEKHIEELKNCLSELNGKECLQDRKVQLRRECGTLMEQIAYLTLNGLRGVDTFKSFQSAGPQYDLLASGDNPHWLTLCKIFYLSPEYRDILVEAKARESKVTDQQFSRICNVISINLRNVGMGIFFTLSGATGFPDDPKKRQRSLKDAKLRQVLFHAQTDKKVIVFDAQDIFSLWKNGSFPLLVIRKIRDLTENTGLPVRPIEIEEIDLPKHIHTLHNE